MFYRTARFHRLSLSDTERDRTREQKAKDWDVLEKICKIHPVGTPKVHLWKLAHGGGAIYQLMSLKKHPPCFRIAPHKGGVQSRHLPYNLNREISPNLRSPRTRGGVFSRISVDSIMMATTEQPKELNYSHGCYKVAMTLAIGWKAAAARPTFPAASRIATRAR